MKEYIINSIKYGKQIVLLDDEAVSARLKALEEVNAYAL